MKEERIEFRATAAQRAEMQAAADRAEQSLSEWLRTVALKAARKEKS